MDAKDRESVAAHIEQCEACNAEIQEFVALRVQIEGDESRGLRARDKRPSALKKPASVFGIALALIATIFGLVFWGYEHRMQSRITELERANRELEVEKSALTAQAGAMKTTLPPQDARLSLQDGERRIAIDEKGELAGLDATPQVYRDAVKDALTTGRVPIPPLPRTSNGRVGTRLGPGLDEKSFDPVYPVGTAIKETRPGLEWQRLPGATSYTVILKDLATGAEMEGAPTRKTTWTPDKDLVRGHQYDWMIEAEVGDQYVRGPSPEKPFATFRVLDAREAQELDLASKSCGGSHLAMGVIYAKFGLIREAEREFAELVSENPGSFMAKGLLESVRAKGTGGLRR